tara:strand:- start:153 stop:281 length:129 start_codon:yes stop_codon:yes gene_type:complete
MSSELTPLHEVIMGFFEAEALINRIIEMKIKKTPGGAAVLRR